MPTVAEMDMLNRGLDDLAGTLQRNRALTAQDRDRQRRAELDREMMGLRREEFTAASEDRRLGLEAQTAHQQRIEAIQKEGNETKRKQLFLEFLGELNKTGQLTDEGISKMEEVFNNEFAPAGLGLKPGSLFRRATPVEPTSKDFGGGVRGVYMPGGKEVHVIDDRGTVTEENDELTGQPKRKFQRRLAPGELEAAMKPGAPESGADMDLDAATREGKLAPLRTELQEHLGEIRKGDNRYGIVQQNSRPERVKELQRQMAELEQPGLSSTPATAPQKPGAEPAFATEAEARAAGHKAGDIVRLTINGKPTRVRLK